MHDTNDHAPPLRVGSLFSGYGGLDLAVEYALDAETVWFSENNEAVARVFAHHWPGAPNLGDITTIDWRDVPPVDVLCGGFPCQDLSTVGKRAGLAPGTRSGLWSYMATAIDALHPEWVVIENVRGLLSSPASRAPLNEGDNAHCNPEDATVRSMEPELWHLGNAAARPLRAAGAVLGDLASLRMDAQWIGLPASLMGAPHHRFRIFILAHRQDAVQNSAGDRFGTRQREFGPGAVASRDDRAITSGHRLRPPRAKWLAEQMRRVGEPVVPDRGHLQHWGRYAHAIARWEHIIGRPAPTPALLNEETAPHPSPAFVEWLMGLPSAWVTHPTHQLTTYQQTAALGNGVLPLQALGAVEILSSPKANVR